MISLTDIEHLAELARIELGDEEKKKLQKDVGAILEYVSQIQEVSSVSGAPRFSPAAPVTVMREDLSPHESGLHTEKLLAAAPEREGNYVKVKKIL